MNIVWTSSGHCRVCSNPGGSLTEQNPFLGVFSTPEECCMDALGYVNTNIQDYSTTVSEECTISSSWVGYNCIFSGDTIYGCMDSFAANFNEEANIDDGSCEFPGCTDSEAFNYNPNANIDDGTCNYTEPIFYGCIDELAINYDSQATEDDGSCEYSQGCTDPNALNYDSTAIQDDGSCEYEIPPIPGCTDINALNYNSDATQDDGSCNYFDYIDDFLFPNQWYMGGDNYCFSGGSMSNFPYPNGCFARGFAAGMPEPQMSINWHNGVEQYGFGTHNPIIAVIDDGFDIEHQDLVNQLWTCPPDGNNGACEPGTHGFSFWNNSSNPPFHHSFYTALHGTATAGILAGEHNGVGTAGICPNCQLMLLHTHLGSTADMPPGGVPGLPSVAQAIYFAVENGARVISYSDSYALSPSSNSPALVIEAIQYAADNNVLFMNAAGNSPFRVSETGSNGQIHGPTNSPESFSIGGFENYDGNYFDYNTTITGGNAYGVEINVGAPAFSIIAPSTILPTTLQDIENVIFGDGDTSDVHWWDSDYPTQFRNLFNDQGLRLIGPDNEILFENETDNLYRNFGGTSGATPMVAGLAGLLLSHNPNLTREDLINIIIDSATDMTPYQDIPFNTEIEWGVPEVFWLPTYPYSTSISPEEIPKMINVFSALNLLYSGGFQFGDVNLDFSVDILDVVQLVNAILETPFDGYLPASTMPQADLNEDGFIDVLDLLGLINNILTNPQTSSAEQQTLQTQLERLQNINTEVEIKPIPNSFDYIQSDNQAFYFFDTQKLLNQRNLTSSPNKVLVATCNDFVVGYTRMDTRYIDVEAMGVTSGILDTENYCASGEKPNFFIQDLETNTQHRLKNNLIEPFIPNATYNVNINELDQVNITINEEVDKLEQASKDKNWNSVDRIIRNLKSQFDKNNK